MSESCPDLAAGRRVPRSSVAGHPARSARRAAALIAACALALALAAPSVPAARAQDVAQPVANGLTAPAGILVDPAGRLWVSDAQDGFCRITEASGSTPGAIEPATCIGGASGARPGPVTPGQAALVGSGSTQMALIPDKAAGSSEITRATWSAATKTFSYSSKLTLVGPDLRPVAVAAGSDGNAYVVFSKALMVLRIDSPTTPQPSVETVAYVSAAPPTAIAVGAVKSSGQATVYVAEANRLTSFVSSVPGNIATVTPNASYPVGVVSSLAFDSTTGMLYAGTATASSAGGDQVTTVNTHSGAVTSAWATGLTRVGGIAVRQGSVYVAEDPGQLANPPAAGEGLVAAIVAGPTITSGPGIGGASASTNNTKPTFGVKAANASGAALQCAFDPETAGATWGDCSGGSYTPSTALADGSHTFAVRAGPTGSPVEVTFIVDTVAPTVSASPGSGTVPDGQRVTLTSSKPATVYYTTDGSTPTTSSTVYSSAIVLTKSITVKYFALDAAGNKSAVGAQTYTVKASATTVANDYNSDGHPDVVAEDTGGNLWLYPGNGKGGWLATSQVGSGWSGMTAIFGVGDFDGQGHPDVMARDPSGNLWLYPSDGQGGWLPWYQVGTAWNSMTAIFGVGDFDGQGHPEVMARDAAGNLWLYPGNGKGGWLAPYQVGTGWNEMTAILGVGDFDGQGHPEVMARDSAGNLWLYPGNGKGGWLAPYQIGSGWNGMTAILGVGDFDGQGHSDVMARDAAGNLWLYPGDGQGGWLPWYQVGSGWNIMAAIL